jgi:hypothetical protein
MTRVSVQRYVAFLCCAALPAMAQTPAGDGGAGGVGEWGGGLQWGGDGAFPGRVMRR